MLIQIPEIFVDFVVVVVVAIITCIIVTYLMIMRYEGPIGNSSDQMFSEESYISNEDLEKLLTTESLESEIVRRILEKAEMQSELRAYTDYLRNFFLSRELRLFQTMADVLLEDGTVNSGGVEILAGGWRNKNKLRVKSGLSKKALYGRSGVMNRFLALGLVVRRESPTRWGAQKYQYCLNKGNAFVREYVRILRESRELE